MNTNRTFLSIAICLLISGFALAGDSRGRLGVYLMGLDDGARQETSFEGEGVLISGVVPKSGADEAGLETGDIIVAINGKDVKTSKDIIYLMEATEPGENVTLAYFRDGEMHDAAVLLGESSIFKVQEFRDGNKWVFATGGAHAYLGIEMKDLNDQLAEYFDVNGGILVNKVLEDSPAAEAGLKAGDVITSFADQEIGESVDLHKLLRDFEEGDKINLGIVRKGKNKSVEITLGSYENHSENVFQFFSDDEDTIIVRPRHLKKMQVSPKALDIHIPEIEIHEMMRSIDGMEDFRAEMENLKKELERVKEELKELKEPE